MQGGRGKSALPAILLTLFIDLVGFSLLFPLFAAMMHYYQEADSGLLKSVLAWFDEAFPGIDDSRRAAFFGGFLLAIYSLLQFIVAPVWGALSDRYGRRPIIICTVIGNFIGYLFWIFAGSFVLLVIGRVINGLAAGNIATLTAAAADTTTPEKRTRVMGAVGAAFGIGFICGPAIGGISHAFMPDFSSYGFGLNPFSGPAIIAAALSFLNLVWVLKAFPETKKPETKPAAHKRSLNPIALFIPQLPGVGRVNTGWFFFMTSFTIMETGIVFLVSDLLGYGTGATTAVFLAVGFTSALVQGGIVRRLSGKVAEQKLAQVGIIFVAIGLVSIAATAWWTHWLPAWAGAIAVSAGAGLVMPSMTSLVSVLAGERQGAVLGQFRSLGALARVFGPLLCAVLYFGFGAPWPFLAAAVILILPFGLLLGSKQEPLHEPQQ